MCNLLKILIVVFIFSSCEKNRINKKNSISSNQSCQPLEETVIEDLPDSISPQIVQLNERIAPKQVSFDEHRFLSEIDFSNGVSQARRDSLVDNRKNNILGKLNIQNFTTDDGLALDAIGCSMVDSKGNIWFGTYGSGVSKYNGKSFTNFSYNEGLSDNVILSIVEDNIGNIWFGTLHGLCYYDGRSIKKIIENNVLDNYSIYSLFKDRVGKIWIGTDGHGVFCYNGKKTISYAAKEGFTNKNVYSIIQDKLGNIWFGTDGDGIICFNGKSFKKFTITNGLASNTVFSLLEDKDGNLWVGTLYGGVSFFNGLNFKNFLGESELGNKTVFKIIQDKSGIIWCATDGSGVSAYDGKSFKYLTTDNGLAYNTVYSIAEDNSGNIWFSTLGGGVSRYSGSAITSYTTEHGLANSIVMSIEEDSKGNLWFGYDIGGISCYDGTKFFALNNDLKINSSVYSICQDSKNNIWIATLGEGVKCLSNNKLITYTKEQGLVSDKIFYIHEDKSGNIWFASYDEGICKFDGKSFVNYTTKQGLASNQLFSIGEDDYGYLYFGTDGGGVSRYDGKSFINLSIENGLSSNKVISIEKDLKGNLWFGTDEGLSVLSNKIINEFFSKGVDFVNKNYINKVDLFTRFTNKDGLPNLTVTQVKSLPDGRIAIGTNLGVAIFTPDLDYPRIKNMEVYNTSTGFPIKDVNNGRNSLFYDSKGVFWIGTGSEKSALIRFDYNKLKKNSKSSSVEIKSLKINNESICWYDLLDNNSKCKVDSAILNLQEFSTYGFELSNDNRLNLIEKFGDIEFDSVSLFNPIPMNLKLPYEHNNLTFEFEAIETDRPFLVNYQYQLEGNDIEWSPVTANNIASYSNIKEGDYVFKLKVQNSNGIWSEPIKYSFKVLPPLHRTWWAYLFYFIFIVMVVWLLIKWRERKLFAEKIWLQKLVDERTVVVENQKQELIKKNKRIEEEKLEVDRQRRRSDDLLLNILPFDVAEELKSNGSAEARQYDMVTILFTDFKDFTQLASSMNPKELVEELNTYFKGFDEIIDRYNIEKIKTIGDSYMCVCGLPQANDLHAELIMDAAIEIQNYLHEMAINRIDEGKSPFLARIGIHSGPVVAGIVGTKKFSYDVWGDTVNIASRMESHGEVGKINISLDSYNLIKEKYSCTYRGEFPIKGSGNFKMYFLDFKL